MTAPEFLPAGLPRAHLHAPVTRPDLGRLGGDDGGAANGVGRAEGWQQDGTVDDRNLDLGVQPGPDGGRRRDRGKSARPGTGYCLATARIVCSAHAPTDG